MNTDSPLPDGILVEPASASCPVSPAAAIEDLPAIRDFLLHDSDGVAHRLSEFTATGLAVVIYARGSWCPFCLCQLSNYAERFAEFKRSGIEVVARLLENQRRIRRLRKGLRLPFTLLSDTKFEASKALGLEMDERYGGRLLQPCCSTLSGACNSRRLTR
jgi:peroxiredoxin